MIFYFSATGNSQSAAESIAEALGERLISIGTAIRDKHFSFDISGDEYLGFVVPTFAYTLPGPAALFIEKLELIGYKGQYTFGVFTCGAGTGDEGAALNAALSAKGLGYNGSFDIVMPDNFIMWSSIPSASRLNSILSSAENKTAKIIEKLKAKQNGSISTKAPRSPFMAMEHISTADGSSKFYSTDRCIGCGSCAKRCPLSCISIRDGKPYWEGNCSMCLTCLHRCPESAIEYADQTTGKKRYVNPNCDFSDKNSY